MSFSTDSYGATTLQLNDVEGMRQVIMSRGLLSPFGHIAWTAMSAGALWRVMGKAPFRLEMLKDARFTRVFAVAVVLHMIWNSPWNPPFEGKHLLLGVVAWIIVLGLVQEGLEELQTAKAASGSAAAAPPETAEAPCATPAA